MADKNGLRNAFLTEETGYYNVCRVDTFGNVLAAEEIVQIRLGLAFVARGILNKRGLLDEFLGLRVWLLLGSFVRFGSVLGSFIRGLEKCSKPPLRHASFLLAISDTGMWNDAIAHFTTPVPSKFLMKLNVFCRVRPLIFFPSPLWAKKRQASYFRWGSKFRTGTSRWMNILISHYFPVKLSAWAFQEKYEVNNTEEIEDDAQLNCAGKRTLSTWPGGGAVPISRCMHSNFKLVISPEVSPFVPVTYAKTSMS